jgi:3'-phosphoadenosine 5'-phosphosulfate sulfotransferase (PAPS reductase)/FAD synthetase
MKKYLSFGGGVNSVAMLLHLHDLGWKFEPLFVNHGCDWPETYQYLAGFQWWLKANGYPAIKILQPSVEGYSNLYEYCAHYRMTPSFVSRWCTDKFKVRVLHKYQQGPAFELIGIDAGESHRAKLKTKNGVESRYPLIELGINRAGCKQIIIDHGLPVPMKSGCWFCTYQRKHQWQQLRRDHPCLFVKAQELEQAQHERRDEAGKSKIFLVSGAKWNLSVLVEEDQAPIFSQDEYPPCQCGL